MFSPVSEAVVLFSVPAVFWHLLLVQFAARASPRRLAVVGTVAFAWTALAYLVVRYDIEEPLVGDLPVLPLLSLGVVALATWLLRDVLLGDGDGVPQQLLVALQLFRPIGMLFVLENSRGALPASFAQPAGWGDLLAGLVALAVLLRYPRGPIPARAVVLVAVVGLLDFASAFFFGFTSSDTPLQLFAFDNPNQVLEYPLGLIPVFLVPYAVAAHILSLAQLARDRARARASQQAKLGVPATS